MYGSNLNNLLQHFPHCGFSGASTAVGCGVKESKSHFCNVLLFCKGHCFWMMGDNSYCAQYSCSIYLVHSIQNKVWCLEIWCLNIHTIGTSRVKWTNELCLDKPLTAWLCGTDSVLCPGFNLWPKLVQPFSPGLCFRTQLNKPCMWVPEIDVRKHETNEKASQIPDLCLLESTQVITRLKFVRNVKNLPLINPHT